MFCNSCQSTGFLNVDQAGVADPHDHAAVLDWIDEQAAKRVTLDGCSCHVCAPCSYCLVLHDVQVCDCCGNGEDWYGEPGYHYTQPDEPFAECA